MVKKSARQKQLEKARKDQQAAKKAAGNAAQAPVDCMEVDDGSGDDEPPELDAVSSSLEDKVAVVGDGSDTART